jgi:tRNA-dihydrouridine synthase A
MMDWTDRHCRYFLRGFSPRMLLYTEMITASAIIRGDREHLLAFDRGEHPVALQLGGCEPDYLAAAARDAMEFGYDEINLNCGCPSDKVQKGAFGACLMNEPALVADCVAAMCEVVDVPVTVKMRIGTLRASGREAEVAVQRFDERDYDSLCDFIVAIRAAGANAAIVHARKAVLGGWSPQENREIPPLRYDLVHRLKRDFPHLTIAINGGLKTQAQIAEQLASVDGVMVGREAYHNPWCMASWDETFWAAPSPAAPSREAVEESMVAYMEQQQARAGTPWARIARHMLGLWNGTPGARRWRQVWSDHRLKTLPPREVWALAHRRG